MDNGNCFITHPLIEEYGLEKAMKLVKEDVEKELKSNETNNAKLIYQKIEKDGGKYVSFGGRGNYGILVCATSTDEDYYWCFLDKDRNIQFSSCVGGYEILDEDDLPNDLSVLDYLYKHQRKELRNLFLNKMKNKKYDYIFTKIKL